MSSCTAGRAPVAGRMVATLENGEIYGANEIRARAAEILQAVCPVYILLFYCFRCRNCVAQI